MKLPDHLDRINNEFIGIDSELFYVNVELVDFSRFPAAVKLRLQTLLDSDLIAQTSLDVLGITGEAERLHKFGICNYGGFDNLPDIDAEGNDINDYYDCGERGTCPVEGKLCHHIQAPNGHLTPREIEVIKLVAQDLGNKQIADQLGCSIHTIHTHHKNIAEKIGCDTKVGICGFAFQKRII